MSTNKRLAEFFVHFSSITKLFVKLSTETFPKRKACFFCSSSTIWNFKIKILPKQHQATIFNFLSKISMKNGIV